MGEINDLFRKLREWEMYHSLQLTHGDVNKRPIARAKRDALEEELKAIGFTPCYVDGQFMLIVYQSQL